MTAAGYTLTITFETDWHIGSGTGIPGSVDRQVLRDENGLPYVPAKTLTGMLRDGAELVAAALDASRKQTGCSAGGTWNDVVCSLFGGQPPTHGGAADASARPARLSVGPARLSESLRNKLAQPGNAGIRDAMFFLQPGIRIDRRSGRSEEDHLFFSEEVCGGLSLSSDLSPEGGCQLGDEEAALLAAAAAAVRRIGGKRRRGGGKCGLDIKGLPEPPGGCADWLDWLEKNDACDLSRFANPPNPASFDEPAAPSAAGGWLKIPLRLRAETPLFVHRATLGNAAESLEHVPGTLLLPHAARALRALGLNPSVLNAAIGKGDLAVTPFYPEVAGGRGLPVPNAWFRPKDGKGLNAPDGVVRNAVTEKLSGGQFKGYREGYIALDAGGEVTGYDDAREIITSGMHNTVEDPSQRPTEQVGGVYGYEAIRAGTCLGGELRIRADLVKGLKPGWERSLAGPVRVGRSKKDDYGRASLEVVESPGTSSADRAIPLHEEKYLIVYLESDVLLRDGLLAYAAHPDSLRAALATRLGCTLAWCKGKELGGDLAAVGRVRRHESWNVSWGLPRPSLVGLQAGSVYVFSMTGGTWDGGKAADLEDDGIGDRRAEGYGRIRLNPPFLLNGVQRAGTGGIAGGSGASCVALTPDEKALLRRLEIQSWKERILRAARRHAYGPQGNWLGLGKENWWRGGKPAVSPSQWGSLRSAAMACTEWEENGQVQWSDVLAPLREWLNGIEKTANRKKKWGESRLGALKALWDPQGNETGRIWQYLGGEPVSILGQEWRENASAGGPASLADCLRPFAVRALLDALCAAVFDVQREKGGQG